jgi:hypothetical protein
MSKIKIVNLSTYVSPKIVEDKRNDFVGYGEDNNYYQYLIDQYQGSPTNNAIINGVTEMIYGKGLNATNSDKKPMEYAEMISLFKKECLKKICADFYLLGQATFQVFYNLDRSKIVKVEHFPVQTLRAEKADKKGDIKAYYYFHDWAKYTNRDKLTRIPAFGKSTNSAIEILCIKPYRAGYFYYTPVTYQGALPYCELEAEVANFHINNIQNGMAPSMLINFNNGTPDEEARELIERRIYDKFSGSSNAGKFILAFNDNSESAATIDPVQLSDAHNQYQFLSDEATKKIMVGHRVVSPLLLGIKDATGLGNNADELEKASILFDNMVIRVQQEYILDAIDQILAFNDIALNTYFTTLQPLEFTDLSNNDVDEETKEEETGVENEDKEELSTQKTELQSFIELGEDEDLDNWELQESAPVDYDKDEELNNKLELTSTGSAKSNAKSEQDGTNVKGFKFKVRYKYMPEKFDDESREFCKKMVQASKIYRKEDIMAMSSKAVNPGWGEGGADTYDIWLYKGGGSCRHYWERRVYMAKTVTPDAKNPRSEISVNEARREGFKPETNDKDVAKRPRDMEKRGFIKDKNFKTPKNKAF